MPNLTAIPGGRDKPATSEEIELEEWTRFVDIKRAIMTFNDSQKIGVAWLQTMSIEALEAIRDRLSKAQDREGRWVQTAQIGVQSATTSCD
jgi:hypothetical protein